MKRTDTHEATCIFRSINIRNKWNSNVWVLVWVRKSKVMLHGYRQFFSVKRVIELMKDELGGKIMTETAALRLKTYSYLTDDNENKKQKAQKSKSSRKT